jgi:hypothetical protein
MCPAAAVTLFSRDALIITITTTSPGQNEDKTVLECMVLAGLF